MFMMCGYDFCEDINALNPAPIKNDNFNQTELTNGIFSHWYVTKDTVSPYSSTPPTEWDFLTLMDANFNGNINAGNLTTALSNIDSIKIKRRKKDEFDWITLKSFPVEDSLSFVFEDNLAQSLQEYEYAFVPITAGAEGQYITGEIATKFEGVFICDFDTIYKFYAGVNYGENSRVQKVGVFEPFGKQYPVIVSNALTNYETGSFSGTVLSSGYVDNRVIDRPGIVKERKQLLDFLTNKKPKILKDWNSGIWLLQIIDNPKTVYKAKTGMGLLDVSAMWVEIGDADKQSDLYNTGMIQEAQ